MPTFVPGLRMIFDIPAIADDVTGRLHNRLVKESITESIQAHHQRTIRRHFEPSARSRYRHYARSPRYVAEKKRKFGHSIDNVYSGATRRDFSQPGKPVRIGGTAVAGTITARLLMRFPFADANRFKGTQRRLRNPRTRERADELTRWHPSEEADAARDFEKRYADKVNAFRGARKRKYFRTK